MTASAPHPERLAELLSDRAALGSLAPAEAAELDRLLREHPGVDATSYELAAAAAAVALLRDAPAERLPEGLARAIEASGRETVASIRNSTRPAREVEPIPFRQPAPARSSAGLAWLAAAACLVMAITGWWPGLFTARTPTITAPQPLTLAQLRDELLVADPQAIKVAWAMPAPEKPDAACPSGCQGDVVWSPERQIGYMRFTGLAANDPGQSQYQLWIFDKNQPEETPVDGGVFDITASGEVIIPIDAKLKVVEPFLFAVTVEKPGGVVRSKRERIPVLAKVG